MYRSVAYALSMLVTLSACSDDTTKDTNPTDGTDATDTAESPTEMVPVTVNFAGKVNGADFACGQGYSGLGVNLNSYVEFADFRFYVTDLKLIGEDRREYPVTMDVIPPYQFDGLALIDFEDGFGLCSENGTPEINTSISGMVPNVPMAGVQFTIGVPKELSHSPINSLSTPPLDVEPLFRNELLGRMFMRLDMDTLGEPDGFPVHISDAGCKFGDSPFPECPHDARTTYILNEFNAEENAIVIDAGLLLSRVNPDENSNDPVQTPPGCMSYTTDADCREIAVTYGMSQLEQTFISVE